MQLSIPSLSIIRQEINTGRDYFSLIGAAVDDFLDPNKPGNRETLLAAAEKALADVNCNVKYAVCIADVVEAMAGGVAGPEHIIADLKALEVLPSWLEGTVREALTELEKAIQAYRSGK